MYEEQFDNTFGTFALGGLINGAKYVIQSPTSFKQLVFLDFRTSLHHVCDSQYVFRGRKVAESPA
jgi:hypothetical protein